MELRLAVDGARTLCAQAPTLRVGYFFTDIVTTGSDWRVRVRVPRSGPRSPLDAYVATVASQDGGGSERLTVHEDGGVVVHAALTRVPVERDTYVGTLWGVRGSPDSSVFRSPTTAVPAIRVTLDQSELLMMIGAIDASGRARRHDARTCIVTLESVQCSGLLGAWISDGDLTNRQFVFAVPCRERRLVSRASSTTGHMETTECGPRGQPVGMATPFTYWAAIAGSVRLLAPEHLSEHGVAAITFAGKSNPPVVWISTGLTGETEAVCVATSTVTGKPAT
jgi:hypothetical protein